MTNFDQIFFLTKLQKISIICNFLKLGIAQSSSEDEIFGHVKLLLILICQDSSTFDAQLPISHNLKRIESVGNLIQNLDYSISMQGLYDVTRLGMKKAHKKIVCMGSFKKDFVKFGMILAFYHTSLTLGCFPMCRTRHQIQFSPTRTTKTMKSCKHQSLLFLYTTCKYASPITPTLYHTKTELSHITSNKLSNTQGVFRVEADPKEEQLLREGRVLTNINSSIIHDNI